MSPNSDSILSQELSRRTALKALFGAASAAVLFGLPARAHAAEASKETTDKLNATQAQLDEVQAQLDSIANEYAALANKNAQTLNDIENVQGKIDDTQAQIDEKKAELKKKRNDLSDRVAASYKSGGTNILSLLLASGSFEELVANAHYVEKINKSDRDAIEDIQTIQEELDAQKTELESQKADLEKLKDQQTAQMQDMQAKQQEVQTVLNGLSDDVKELMAQRDSEILAAAQAEEAARKAAAAADLLRGGRWEGRPLPRLPRTRTIPTRVARARVVDRTRPELRSRMPARASSRLSSTRATPRLRRVRTGARRGSPMSSVTPALATLEAMRATCLTPGAIAPTARRCRWA